MFFLISASACLQPRARSNVISISNSRRNGNASLYQTLSDVLWDLSALPARPNARPAQCLAHHPRLIYCSASIVAPSLGSPTVLSAILAANSAISTLSWCGSQIPLAPRAPSIHGPSLHSPQCSIIPAIGAIAVTALPPILGGLEIDHQLDLCGPLHRQVGGLFALENAPSVVLIPFDSAA
jgi:hypothetical protein